MQASGLLANRRLGAGTFRSVLSLCGVSIRYGELKKIKKYNPVREFTLFSLPIAPQRGSWPIMRIHKYTHTYTTQRVPVTCR